jgi:D-alanine--poly(phosphoribitol) ligase subunit 1
MRFDVATKLFIEENAGADKIAFAAADKDLSWSDLKILSDKICDAFKKINIPAGYPVLIYGDKEAFFLASILSCYRMNITFVPLSPALPKKRIEKIIEQTQSDVFINCGNYTDIPKASVTIDQNLNASSALNKQELNDRRAAYILFTSGSSGEPKGVKISNENIIAFTIWLVKDFGVNEKTVFINVADFSFDISLADFFGALQTGGTAIFNTSAISTSTNLFFERINKYKGNYWNSTPSFIVCCLADKNFNTKNLSGIGQFVLSGENLSVQLVKDLETRFPKAKIMNAYGPTETTIYAGYAEVTKELLNGKSLPICKKENVMLSLKNEEIIISGETVGLGYLNNEKLTSERFSKNSFQTGDLAFEKNGYIYFNGRKDEQIKFNGFRIELNEIKCVLEKIDFITQAECMPIIIDNKIKRLIAFVKLKSENINVSSVRDILKAELPHYMIPSEIITVKEFPTTASFKIDKQKLLNDYLTK